MRVSIMQPYFFPYIGYFQLIANSDVFVIYDDVNFIKKGFINRNSILVNGQPFKFTMPLQRISQNKLINELYIVDSNIWRLDLLKTIKNSYPNAPFFNEVYLMIEEIINYQELNLSLYLKNSIEKICNYLSISTQFILSSEIIKNNDLKGEDKIMDICRLLKANQYVNAIGGIELYNKEKFSANNIDLKFMKSENILYQQFKNDFVPWLSIIDVMMFNSVDNIRMILNRFELI